MIKFHAEFNEDDINNHGNLWREPWSSGFGRRLVLEIS